jgi:hypothetical protein
MPLFDDLGLFKTFATAAANGQEPSIGLPILLASRTVQFDTGPFALVLNGVAAPQTHDRVILDVPTSLQPFVSIWALIKATWTSFGDTASLTFSVGTTAPYNDLVIQQVENGPPPINNLVYGLVDTIQGAAHYGVSNQLSGIGIIAGAGPGTGTVWVSNSVTLRIETNNTGAALVEPVGSARVYILGFKLE